MVIIQIWKNIVSWYQIKYISLLDLFTLKREEDFRVLKICDVFKMSNSYTDADLKVLLSLDSTKSNEILSSVSRNSLLPSK